MPTPTTLDIPLFIDKSPGGWLVFDGKEIFMPRGILPGQTVQVSGCLRALICNKNNACPRYDESSVRDSVIIKSRIPGFERIIPDFTGEKTIPISFPVTFSHPRFANSVSPGSCFTVKWTVRNSLMHSITQVLIPGAGHKFEH